MAACESSRPPELLGVTPVTPMTRTRGETHRRVRNAAWHRARGGTGVVLADDLRGPRLAENRRQAVAPTGSSRRRRAAPSTPASQTGEASSWTTTCTSTTSRSRAMTRSSRLARPFALVVEVALAVAQLVCRVALGVHHVPSAAAVDRPVAEVPPDVIVARAADDVVDAVAGVDPVVTGTAEQHIVLPGVVARGELIAPEDVVAR